MILQIITTSGFITQFFLQFKHRSLADGKLGFPLRVAVNDLLRQFVVSGLYLAGGSCNLVGVVYPCLDIGYAPGDEGECTVNLCYVVLECRTSFRIAFESAEDRCDM